MSRAVYSYFERMEPCSEIEKTLIMEAADDFSDQIAIDVKNFILQLCMESIAESPRKVIVFPEVNDLGELLIDEIVKIFPNLISFTVGPPKTKRIVVCSHAIVKNKVLLDLAAGDATNSVTKEKESVQEIQSAKVTTNSNSITPPSRSLEPEGNCTPSPTAKVSKVPVIDSVSNIRSCSTSNLDVTSDDHNVQPSSFVDEASSSSLVEHSQVEPAVDVHLKNKKITSEDRSTAKIARPDEGTFRRVMTELYIAADRHHRVESKVPPSCSSNNWTRNLRNSSSQLPPQVSQIPTTTTTRSTVTAPVAHLSPPVSEKSSSSDEDKGVPCLVQPEVTGSQPEEDVYWKKLACSHLHEISCILGSVEIVKPKWKQISYDMQISLKEHALGHILETYNMNERIVTRDLTLMFSKFKTSGFNIKWVDASKALVVFSSASKAAEALMVEHPIIKTRPVLIASRESKLRILQCSQFLLPYKDRPKTVATVARRMISNSLGISPKVEVNPEVAEKERNIIEQARAEKLLREKGEYLKSREKIEQGAPQCSKTEQCDDVNKNQWMSFEFSTQ